jgi:general secretion pathway protein K
MALLLVLVVVALLSSLLIEFSFSSLVDLRATETFRDRTKAYYLARGGIEAGRAILREDSNGFDHPSEFWGDELANIPAGDGDVSLLITDLSGRFNVNFVADTRGNPLPGYYRFIALCQDVLEYDSVQAGELADALVYWFNADKTTPTPDDLYYAGLDPPYSRRGGRLLSLDELQMVRGFSAQVYEKLKPYLRIVGGEQVNLNTASAAVLYSSQFSAAEGNVEILLDRTDIDMIVQYRRQSPLREKQDLGQVEGLGDRWVAAWLPGAVEVTGEVYRIVSLGRINDGTRRAVAVVRKQGNELITFRVE